MPEHEAEHPLDKSIIPEMTGAEAVGYVLGPQPDWRTGDAEADCLAAMEAIDRYRQDMVLWRRVILHHLYDIYHQPDEDIWLKVAQEIGQTKSTTWSWAHPRGL
jgi:hypothetical protein